MYQTQKELLQSQIQREENRQAIKESQPQPPVSPADAGIPKLEA